MRFMLIFLIFSCFLSKALGRTVPLEEQGQDSEAEAYEGDEEAEFDEASQVQEEGGGDGGINENDSERLKTTEEPYNSQTPNAKSLTSKRRTTEGGEEGERSEEPSSRNDETQSQKSHNSDTYENYQPEMAQLTKLIMNDFRNNRVQGNAPKNNPTNKIPEEEDGTLLFENNYRNRQQTSNKDEYNNNEDGEQSEQSRFFNKRYYNTMDAENRGRVDHGNYENIQNSANRDRRETQDAPTTSELGNMTTYDKTPETPNESEESAIKRHIQKLSTSELQQLIGSLSEDKRILLQKIIDSNNSDYIDKRETAKKAGAVEDNSLTENGQLDNVNLEGGTSIAAISDSELANTAATEANRSPTESDLKALFNLDKSPEPSDKPDMKSETLDGIVGTKAAESNVAFTTEPQHNTEPEPTKSDTKREANNEDYNEDEESLEGISQDELVNEKDYQPLQDKMLNNEGLSDRSENQKRDTQKAADFANAMKSLEESFPNPTAYEETDPYFGEDMTPLVRVKRKTNNVVQKKRFAAASLDSKVSYFPSNADIDDNECDEEPNEFDEDRFYDRPSNFKKSKDEASDLEETPEVENAQTKLSNYDNADNSQAEERNLNAPKSDSSDLGSDTDSVLDGVEGGDDNLMYSNKARNRRSTPDYVDTNENIPRSAETYAKSPQYQENDAFGPLPTNYEGEQSRYKRIREIETMPPANDRCDA